MEVWIHPPEGLYKLNFDGTINPSHHLAGVGGIIRNHKREIFVAYTTVIQATHPLEVDL